MQTGLAPYLDFVALEQKLRDLRSAHPDVVHLKSLGRSEEGRDLWLVILGKDPDRIRPAAWIDANIHASELVGGAVCLAVIEALIGAYEGSPLADLPPHIAELLTEDVLFYVMPRMCPDGVERVLSKRHFVRSNHRDHRIGGPRSFWKHDDLDGDGRARLMRIRDAAGDFVESREAPGVMLPRQLEDVGPFFKLYPEGTIANFDGQTLPKPNYLSDAETDLNRNFPTGWRPEPKQFGAGKFPGSEPESRAVIEFAATHPNIFLWVCLHTFGGVFIRPLNDRPDTAMAPEDAAVFRQLSRWAESITGYPTVSGFQEFTYEPDKPLYGDLSNFAYEDRGAIAYVVELWDFFAQVGFPIQRPFIKNYEETTSPRDILKMAEWDRLHNEGRVIGTWHPFDHPQLGPVEIGGYDPLIGVWNPPPNRVPELARAHVSVFLRMAALAPRLRFIDVTVTALGPGVFEVGATLENHGFLPTYFLESAKDRPFCDPLRVLLETSGPRVVSGQPEQSIGHLAGWGGNDRQTSLMLARSTGKCARARVTWVVKGSGVLTLRAHGTRVGELTHTFTIGEEP